jgi:hypothetical protein
MNIQKGDYIKHKNFMDVAIRVSSVIVLPDRVHVKGYWFNQGFEKSWPIRETGDCIEIMKRGLCAWRVCKNHQAICLRHETWETV